jgi:hypothetical protein
MADDEPRDAHTLGGPLDREAVEPVAADPEVVPQPLGKRVGRGDLRDGRVKGGVKDRDVRAVGKRLPSLGDRLQRPRVVQRRELGQRLEAPGHEVVNDDRLLELRAAVDEAVRGRRDLGGRLRQRLNLRRRPVRGDEVELQARRPGVDDEDGAVRQ